MSFSAAGNTSTMRSMVLAAELVCRVPNTRWPVSAAVRARRMVSRSRISPTRITSGSSRSAERSASLKPWVCRWTSRWLTRHFLLRWTNSIGSSMVRICPCSDSFLWSIIAARVVDLPEPVGPVTSTTPRRVPATSLKIAGARSSPRESTFDGMVRNTAPAPRWWLECVDAKSGEPGDLEREVRLQVFVVVRALGVVHDPADKRAHRRVVELRHLDAMQVAIDPNQRRKSSREMKIGRAVPHSECKQLTNVHLQGNRIVWWGAHPRARSGRSVRDGPFGMARSCGDDHHRIAGRRLTIRGRHDNRPRARLL